MPAAKVALQACARGRAPWPLAVAILGAVPTAAHSTKLSILSRKNIAFLDVFGLYVVSLIMSTSPDVTYSSTHTLRNDPDLLRALGVLI